MKKLLLVLFVAFTSNAVNADVNAMLKVGGWPSAQTNRNAGVTNALMVSVEGDNCAHCITGSFVNISNTFGKNQGAVLDYTYKIVADKRSALRFSIGAAGFDKPLNDSERFNFHLGVSFDAFMSKHYGVLVSIDHFSNGRTALNRSDVEKNIITNMLSVGIRF